jgi:DNA-binding NarL/FixJ family response regulator
MKLSGIKVIVADDHEFFRIGFKSVLKELDFISEIVEAENGKQAIQQVAEKNYPLVFMDILMPVMNGMEATRILIRDFPDVKVIALSMYEDFKHVIEMIELGARGYLFKNTDTDEIKTAILKVMNNELAFSRYLSASLISSLVHKDKMMKKKYNEMISIREKEILTLICREYNTHEIAESLFLSERTVDWHRQNLLQKTNSKNIAGLVLFALKCGLVDNLSYC